MVSSAWAASYSLQPMTMTFGRSSEESQDTLSSKTLSIKNTGQRPLYLSLTLEKRINPGQENESRITMADTSPEDFGLLLNNTKLIVPPGQERSVLVESLVNPASLKQEAVYSITTTPMESSKFVSESKTDMGGGIAMLLQYAIHVFVSPKNLNDSVSFKQQGNRVVLTNTGNSFNAVSAVYHCPRGLDLSRVTRTWQLGQLDRIQDELQCEKGEGEAFLYAGTQSSYDIPENRQLALVMYNNSKRQTQGFLRNTGG